MLYSLITDKIKIRIEAYFDEDGNLIIDGRDIGTTVEEIWGDSDYEYTTTIHRENLEKLNAAFGLPIGSREQILLFLKTHYDGNGCYSQIQNYLTQHDIPFDKFSWI